jgi:hypothetical protein
MSTRPKMTTDSANHFSKRVPSSLVSPHAGLAALLGGLSRMNLRAIAVMLPFPISE